MEQEFELIAKTFMGLEPVLAQELTELGANNVQTGRRMVSFTGNKEMMYRANFQLHTAIRILKPIAHFKADTADKVYDEIKKIDWTQYLDLKKSFSVDSVVFSEEFRHSKFVSYKVKDAIVDQFREKFGKRPNISVANPDIRLNMHIAEDQCTLSLDSSGESLHRRGYRQESVEAPLNEVLAAGMILMTGIIEDEFIYGMVTNSLSVGGFKGISGPDVLLDDGLFEVTLIKNPKNPIELNKILAGLANRENDNELIYSFKTSELHMESEEEVPWTLDGEFGGSHTDLTITNLNKQITIMC